MHVYQIFDSLDRPASTQFNNASALFPLLKMLQDEAEEDGERLTYAIGKISPDGTITFDY